MIKVCLLENKAFQLDIYFPEATITSNYMVNSFQGYSKLLIFREMNIFGVLEIFVDTKTFLMSNVFRFFMFFQLKTK